MSIVVGLGLGFDRLTFTGVRVCVSLNSRAKFAAELEKSKCYKVDIVEVKSQVSSYAWYPFPAARLTESAGSRVGELD